MVLAADGWKSVVTSAGERTVSRSIAGHSGRSAEVVACSEVTTVQQPVWASRSESLKETV